MEIALNTPDTSKSPTYRRIRGRLPSGSPNPVDVHVGKRVRLRRTCLGISQGKLGEAIGLTFQQVQKYERGTNRIGASRLWDISQALNCPMSFFFEDMEESTTRLSPRNLGAAGAEDTAEQNADEVVDVVKEREALDLLRAYNHISNRAVRNRICDLAKSLATTPEAGQA